MNAAEAVSVSVGRLRATLRLLCVEGKGGGVQMQQQRGRACVVSHKVTG
jgi:hypothetical protein